MPKNTFTRSQWKKRITHYCNENNIQRSAGQIERMAIKIIKRIEHIDAIRNASDAELFEAGLRILGIYTDETARNANSNLQGVAA